MKKETRVVLRANQQAQQARQEKKAQQSREEISQLQAKNQKLDTSTGQ